MNPKHIFYGEILVAFLSDSNIEWPRSDSIFRLSENLSEELKEYIKSSITAHELWENGEEEKRNDLEETMYDKFRHIIDSEGWYIVDKDESEHPIVVPNFQTNNIVVWVLM